MATTINGVPVVKAGYVSFVSGEIAEAPNDPVLSFKEGNVTGAADLRAVSTPRGVMFEFDNLTAGTRWLQQVSFVLEGRSYAASLVVERFETTATKAFYSVNYQVAQR